MGETSILIVEDDFIVAKVIEKSLQEIGYRISGMVGTGREAIALAEREQPDLVLMDINLQGDMDGITAAGTISSHNNIPVVFLTAFSDKTTFSRALETNPYGYIVKPFQTNTLATTIQVALNKYRHEEKQAVRNEWLEGILRSFSEGVVTIDKGGIITLMNPVAERLTGWDAKDAVGQPLTRVLLFDNPFISRRMTIATDPVIAEGIVTTVPDGSNICTKNGSQIMISEAIASPVRDDNGKITGAAIVVYPKDGPKSPEADAITKVMPAEPSPARSAQKGTKSPKGRQPATADSWIDRGNALIFLRRYGDAARAYDNAIALSPTNYQAWYGKGTALSKIGHTEEALKAYDQALSIYPRNHQILMAKGVLLKKIGKDTEAEHCFELAHLYTP